MNQSFETLRLYSVGYKLARQENPRACSTVPQYATPRPVRHVPCRLSALRRQPKLSAAANGIFKNSPAPLGGAGHVLGVKVDGEIRIYPKKRGQAKTLLAALTR